ncbi:MAG: hypothetical protein ACJ760_02240 [Thermoleophilaceae bacterium]
MDSQLAHDSTFDTSTARVLVVTDWSVDAQAVIDACDRRNHDRPASFALVVPAWLHGIDWTGDPRGSVPCARKQLADVTGLAATAGRRFDSAVVGDPDPVAAMYDALADWPADEIILCTRRRSAGIPHPFDLNHRTRRVTGLPVHRVDAPSSNGRPRQGRAGHCGLAQPQAA